jgi:4-amino-4-deoxy-L-arabinose transferase-like glycosyltransferase
MSRLRLARVPSAARWCMLVAFLNCAAWAVITPTFQVPDETGHVAYLQYLAETGKVPNTPGGPGIADEEAGLMDALRFNATVGRPDELSIWSELQQNVVDQTTRERPDPANGGGIIETSAQPPLYYSLAALVYQASPWKGLVHRVLLLRLMSALIASVTVLFVFLFLRELLPDHQWTWTVGALAVAFQPLFAYEGGAVTPDTLLFAAAAALLFAVTRAFRVGLSVGLGAAIGAALAVGFLTKLNFVALLPGALLALALLIWRARDGRRQALGASALAVGIFAFAAGAYMALNHFVWDRALLGGGVELAAQTATGNSTVAPIGLRDQLSYTWQLYLPRLPFMNDQFAYFPPYHTWFRGWVGNFGWLDTRWPAWVYHAALVPFAVLVGLAGVALVRCRATVRARWAELLVYAVMLLGLLGSIGFFGIRFLRESGDTFEQARYLLPMGALYAALVALAALGAGRRLARPAGAVLVLLAMGHGLFAQLLVISRFYG